VAEIVHRNFSLVNEALAGEHHVRFAVSFLIDELPKFGEVIVEVLLLFLF